MKGTFGLSNSFNVGDEINDLSSAEYKAYFLQSYVCTANELNT
jgi:hypothetical protein